MSKHSSLKSTGGAGGKRSVLKRFERIKYSRSAVNGKKERALLVFPKLSLRLKRNNNAAHYFNPPHDNHWAGFLCFMLLGLFTQEIRIESRIANR